MLANKQLQVHGSPADQLEAARCITVGVRVTCGNETVTGVGF